MLSRMEDDLNARMHSKIPSWYNSNCTIPSKLSLEQCSSEQTAAYKASLVDRRATLADLTGGMGVDSHAFSRVCTKVTYIERDSRLFEAAKNNFSVLGADNIQCLNSETAPGMSLGSFDWIYLDPARRSGEGKKVFLLEECSPNVMELLPFLWNHCSRIMLKLSPMADLKMLQGRLGDFLREIHIVGSDGEVKEILCILHKEGSGSCRTFIAELPFAAFEKTGAGPSPTAEPKEGMILFDPSSTIKKAGMFNIDGLSKLGPSTHLFLGDTGLPGRRYIIREVLPLNKSSLESVGKRFPKAEVSAKGLHLTSEELRKRLKVTSGGNVHIFGAGTPGGNLLIVTDSLSRIPWRMRGHAPSERRDNHVCHPDKS